MTTTAELLDSSNLLADPPALRDRAANDGYLFFRGLLPREDVLHARNAILSVLARRGWVREGAEGLLNSDAVASIPDDEMRTDIGISADGYRSIQQVPEVHSLPHHPRLLAIYERLFQGRPFVHPRHIIRAMTDHRTLHPTPPHQDFPLVQGSQNTWTAWFPLGDCGRELGSLCVLPGSHERGYIPINPAAGAGAIAAQLCRGEDNWTGADFAAGDVLTFPAFTVHRASAPTDRSRIRLSMDVRYQPADDPIEARALENHSGAPWAEIYDGWDSEAFQYYWDESTPRVSPWDDSLVQPGQRIC